MLKKELLRILCCPNCRGTLDYKPEKNTLTCTRCGKEYQVKNDIPVLLVDNEH
jgi:uncharacterized protein YbaR (Trm112 family)